MAAQISSKHVGQDFTTGNIWSQLIIFSIPFLAASLLNSLYNTVDMIIIGQFVGSVGTVAVSLGGKMLDLLTNVSLGLAGGGQVLISQLVGAKKREELNAAIGTLFTEMTIFAVGISVFCLVFATNILNWLNTPEESFEAALSYFRITSIGLPLIFGYNAVSSVLRGMGDSRSPLIFIAIAAAANLLLDVVFIVVFHLGATGTALATVIGQGISLFCSGVILYRKREQFGFDFRLRSFMIDREKMKIMLRIGAPMGAKAIFIQGTQLFVISFVNAYGLVQAAAYGIGMKVIHILNVTNSSMRQAGGTMVGQNVGANCLDRVKLTMRASLVINLAAAATVSALSLFFPRMIFGLFTKDTQVLAFAAPYMRVSVMLFFVSAGLSPLESLVTGIGNGRLMFLMGIMDGVVFRLIFSFLFGWYFGMESVGFFFGNAMGKVGPLIVDSCYYFSGAWKRFRKLV